MGNYTLYIATIYYVEGGMEDSFTELIAIPDDCQDKEGYVEDLKADTIAVTDVALDELVVPGFTITVTKDN